MPFMCLGVESLFNNILVPYYEFLLCACITFIGGMLIPYETGGRALDPTKRRRTSSFAGMLVPAIDNEVDSS